MEHSKQVVIDTCIEMMFDRGYIVIDSDDDNLLFENENTSERVLACIFDDSKLNVNNIKDMVKILNENSLTHGIIIYNDIITSTGKKIIDTLQDYDIETFSIDELKFNITKHRLVPKHIKIQGDEYLEVKKLALKLPVLLKNDPVSKYYHYKTGDIIRVERLDKTIAYRLVR